MAVATALVATAAPYVVRPLRRYLPVIPLLCATAALTIPAGLLIDVAAALVLGYGVAAAVHVAFGSPEGRPTLAQVVDRGGRPRRRRPRATPGHAPTLGTGRGARSGQDGSPLHVKALGSDASDAKLLARLWHYVWYRGTARRGGSGLDRVNAEALVTLLAERAGVNVPFIVAVGGDRELALLVEQRSSGRPLIDLGSEQLTDVVLDRLSARRAHPPRHPPVTRLARPPPRHGRR